MRDYAGLSGINPDGRRWAKELSKFRPAESSVSGRACYAEKPECRQPHAEKPE